MSDMLERAAKAIADKWLEKVDDSTVRVGPPVIARAALLAALDPHDSDLQNIILGAMGFYAPAKNEFGPMARVQAHDAIAALRSAASQGGS